MKNKHWEIEKHLTDLPCPICKRPVYFNDRTFRSHMENFHRRFDVIELKELSKKMCGIEETAADKAFNEAVALTDKAYAKAIAAAKVAIRSIEKENDCE